MKIKPIKQIDDIACGPSCIKMVADYFGLPLTLEEINKITDYKKKDGMYNDDIVASLRQLDFDVDTANDVSWQELQKQNTTDKVIIVSWMLNGYIGHVSVVDNVTDDKISLADSIEGKIITMEKIVFLRLWLDYEPHWYPKKNTDIQLRWMAIVSPKL